MAVHAQRIVIGYRMQATFPVVTYTTRGGGIFKKIELLYISVIADRHTILNYTLSILTSLFNALSNVNLLHLRRYRESGNLVLWKRECGSLLRIVRTGPYGD